MFLSTWLYIDFFLFSVSFILFPDSFSINVPLYLHQSVSPVTTWGKVLKIYSELNHNPAQRYSGALKIEIIVSLIMWTLVCLVGGIGSKDPKLTCRYSYTDMHTCITLYSWHYELCVATNAFHCSSFISCNCAVPDSGNSETLCIHLEGCFVKPHGRVSRWKDCSCSTRDRQEGLSSGDI